MRARPHDYFDHTGSASPYHRNSYNVFNHINDTDNYSYLNQR
jgi:hypothetical protein